MDIQHLFLKEAVLKTPTKQLDIEEGTLLVVAFGEEKYLFETAVFYVYRPEGSRFGRTGIIPHVPGSLVDMAGQVVSDACRIPADFVRFPTVNEIMWYGEQKIV